MDTSARRSTSRRLECAYQTVLQTGMASSKNLLLALAAVVAAAYSSGSLATGSFNPANATITQLRAALDEGKTSSEQLVEYYLDRVERFDKRGPTINAFISLNPQARAQARRLDAAGKLPGHRGPLYGIPFAAKDNYDTIGIPTSGGSAALKNSFPRSNAFVIQKLIDQGAILIGKTNMSELAASYGRFGYSSAAGLTLNPYNTARDVSGSSSGSAAAVAADFAPFALGTDTSGSIREPASVAGLVGLRPGLGLTSRSGVIPLALSFDTTGPMTRNVQDMAIVLDAIAGEDPQDAATLRHVRAPGSFGRNVGTQPLEGVRLGVISNFRGANAEVDEVVEQALHQLRSKGAILVPITLPQELENLWDSTLGLVGEGEFKAQFERYLGTLSDAQPKTLGQLIKISASPEVQQSATPLNPKRLKGLQEAQATQLTVSPAYIRVLTDVIPSVREKIKALLEANRLQAFVAATMSCPASPRFDRPDPTYVCKTDDPYKHGYIASATGYPEVTVPAGRITGNMPVGISFLGLPDSEAMLLGLGAAFERIRTPLPPAQLSSNRD